MNIKFTALAAAGLLCLTSQFALAGGPAPSTAGITAAPFSVLGDVPAVKMTTAELADVRGAGHIVNMLDRLGQTFVDGDVAYGNTGGPGNGRGLIIAGSGGTTGNGANPGIDIATINLLHQ